MATIRINCENRNSRRTVDIPGARRAAAIVLKDLGVRDAELNIIFVTSASIRALNRRYLGKDASTDVIAFGEKGRRGPTGKGKSRFLGDIAISSDTAAKNAPLYGSTFAKEILLYVIHGTLHLMGFEDVTEKGRRRMRRKEDECLQKAEGFSHQGFSAQR